MGTPTHVYWRDVMLRNEMKCFRPLFDLIKLNEVRRSHRQQNQNVLPVMATENPHIPQWWQQPSPSNDDRPPLPLLQPEQT